MSHIIPKTFRELRDEYQRVHVGIDPNSLGEFGKHERDIFREVVDDIDRILGIAPDAVTEANALCQAIRERDAYRDAAEQHHTELDAAGIGSRDQFLGARIHVLVVERDEARKRVAELEERPHLAGTCPSWEIGLVTDAGQEFVQQRDAAWVERDALRTKLAEAEIQRDDAVREERSTALVNSHLRQARDALRKQVENWSNELADALGCVNEHSGARQQPCFAEMVEKVRRLRHHRDHWDLDAHRKLDEAGAGTRDLTVVGRIGELVLQRDDLLGRVRDATAECNNLHRLCVDIEQEVDARETELAKAIGVWSFELGAPNWQTLIARIRRAAETDGSLAEQPTIRDQFAMAYMQAGKTPTQAYTLADEALKERGK